MLFARSAAKCTKKFFVKVRIMKIRGDYSYCTSERLSWSKMNNVSQKKGIKEP